MRHQVRIWSLVPETHAPDRECDHVLLYHWTGGNRWGCWQMLGPMRYCRGGKYLTDVKLGAKTRVYVSLWVYKYMCAHTYLHREKE